MSFQLQRKKSVCGKVLDGLTTVLSLRIILLVIYLILFVLLCVIQVMTLFQSPKIGIMNIQASRITGAKVFLSSWYAVDVDIVGANASIEIGFNMWKTTLDIRIDIPYGFLPQNISQTYRVQDVPCQEFRTIYKNMQIFSLLSIFTAFIVLLLTVSNFFTRMFLPLLWLFVWVTVAFTASMTAMMFKLLCDGECSGELTEIPPFTQLAMPMGGFALAVIAFQGFLITSPMTVFL